jgi:FkbM family methyltransferase
MTHFSLVLVGAHDGSKTVDFVQTALALGHVLLIEPVPYLFTKLKARWEGTPRLSLLQGAISTHIGSQDFYAPTPSAQRVFQYGDQLGSFNESHAVNHHPQLAGMFEKIVVQTTTFDFLIHQYEIEGINVLVTDTEGSDAKILPLFPFDKLKPRIIVFEHKHADGTFHIGKQFAALIERLDAEGYQIRVLDNENCRADLRSA